MAFIVVYDACVLFPAPLRDLLVRLGLTGIFQKGYESLIGGLTELPGPDDRHVLAAAIRCGAQAIVTFNLKDFPRRALARYGMEAQHPDEFVLNLIDLDGAAVAEVVQQQAAGLRNPRKTVAELLEVLRQQGLVGSVESLQPLLDV